MDNFIKIMEIFSRNWLIVLVLVLCIPVVRMAVQSYVQVKIAKISNHQKFIIHIENELGRKTLEISSSDLNLNDIGKQIYSFEETAQLVLQDNKIEKSKKVSSE